MRRNRGGACTGAWVAIAIGIIILLGLVLPPAFWWLLCASAFVCGGILLLRR